ncbi:MAG: hypothetical protein KA436_09740 [Oligoflexales bacterium]|nr:hypothetical protein [Oligoflexales bacterium]
MDSTSAAVLLFNVFEDAGNLSVPSEDFKFLGSLTNLSYRQAIELTVAENNKKFAMDLVGAFIRLKKKEEICGVLFCLIFFIINGNSLLSGFLYL